MNGFANNPSHAPEPILKNSSSVDDVAGLACALLSPAAAGSFKYLRPVEVLLRPSLSPAQPLSIFTFGAIASERVGVMKLTMSFGPLR